MENIKATHTLSWYKDRDNIPNQTLVDGIIKYFTVGPRKDFWDIEDLLNLLWGASNHVLENRNAPDEVIESLQNLPLNEEQQHVLFGLLLKLVGGYPVANLDEKCQFVLKRIEVLFLGFPGDTPEKEFCRFDIDDRARNNALSTLYTDAVNGKISKPDLAKLHKKIVGTKRKEFENIDELIDDAVETGRINEDAVKNRTEFKIDFNKWLGETKGWDLYDENEYKKLLTISNLQEYVNQGRGTYEDVMIPSVFKSIIDRHKFAPTFSHYEEYGEIAKSYRYNGLSIKYEDGFELFISSRNIAIFFFVMMPEIAHQEQNAILDDFRRGYEAGYSQVETTINERLGALQHTNENVQVITVRLYAELYSSYNNTLFWRRNAFEQIGHNQGQLYRLKVMMRAIDSIVLAVDAESLPRNAGQPASELPANSNTTTYEYDPPKITAVFKFCSETRVFKDVQAHQFGKCVAEANFQEIYDKKGTVKSKLKRIINKLSHILSDADWYKHAAQSIGTDPSGCTKQEIDKDWLRRLNALK